MRYLLLLFLPLTAMAQWGVEQPFFSVQNPVSDISKDLQALWTYTDLSDGSVTSWTNRLASDGTPSWVNSGGNPSFFVGKSSTGVFFEGNSKYYLTFTPALTAVSNWTVYLVYRRKDNGNDENVLGGGSALYVRTTSPSKIKVAGDCGTMDPCGNGTNNVLHDLTLVFRNQPSGDGYYASYSDGVLFSTNALTDRINNQNTMLSRMGGGAANFYGEILECRFYTNSLLPPLIDLLHNNRTNRFGQ